MSWPTGASPVAEGWRPFRCDARPDGEELRIVVEGELELDSADFLRSVLAQHIDKGFRSVVLDLGGVTFMDSTGLRTVIEVSRTVTGRDLRFAMVPGPPPVQRIFVITGTADMFPPPAPR
jgi:anti-anti-sigma factor